MSTRTNDLPSTEDFQLAFNALTLAAEACKDLRFDADYGQYNVNLHNAVITFTLTRVHSTDEWAADISISERTHCLGRASNPADAVRLCRKHVSLHHTSHPDYAWDGEGTAPSMRNVSDDPNPCGPSNGSGFYPNED